MTVWSMDSWTDLQEPVKLKDPSGIYITDYEHMHYISCKQSSFTVGDYLVNSEQSSSLIPSLAEAQGKLVLTH